MEVAGAGFRDEFISFKNTMKFSTESLKKAVHDFCQATGRPVVESSRAMAEKYGADGITEFMEWATTHKED